MYNKCALVSVFTQTGNHNWSLAADLLFRKLNHATRFFIIQALLWHFVCLWCAGVTLQVNTELELFEFSPLYVCIPPPRAL